MFLKYISNTDLDYSRVFMKKYFIMNGVRMELQLKDNNAIPLIHEEIKMEAGFRADFIIDDKVIIELKSIEALAPVHYKHVLTYLKLSNLKLGLLVNFNVDLIKNGIHRIVNNL
ncbi:MAG: GxxExxY protein [Ginsengibacter sp.]